MQFELKLTGVASDLRRTFRSLNGKRPITSNSVSTHFDTRGRRLWRRGFSLRLQATDDELCLVLEQLGDKSRKHGLWVSALTEPMVGIDLLPDDAPRSEIGVILPEELQPLFTSDIHGAKRRFEFKGASVEASLTLGQISNDDRETPVAELSFRRLSGSGAALLSYVAALAQEHNLVFGARSIAARGMELADDAPPATIKAAKPVLDGSDTLERAVAKIVVLATEQIIGSIAAAEDGRDPEGVHQLRVALRRLRSALTLFKDRLGSRGEVLNASARSALKQLGAARDLDVFLLETIPPVQCGDPDNPDLQRLVRIAEQQKRMAYEDVRKLVRDRAFNDFLFELLRVSEEGGLVLNGRDELLRPSAIALLQKGHKKVLKAGRNFAQLAHPQRHEVRIALKKLRYACDFFQVLFPGKRTRAYLKRLANLQDDLGKLNDATVAETLVDQLTDDDTNAANGAALIKGWYRHRLQTVEPHMLGAWRKFATAQPFWQS